MCLEAVELLFAGCLLRNPKRQPKVSVWCGVVWCGGVGWGGAGRGGAGRGGVGWGGVGWGGVCVCVCVWRSARIAFVGFI